MNSLKDVPRLYIFDMGDVVCGNVHCVPAMAESLSLSAEEFFAAAGVSPSLDDGGSPYEAGDIRAIQEGAMGSEEFWRRFENRAARLFPNRSISIPRRPDGRFEDLWGRFFNPVRNAAVVSIITELVDLGHRVVCGTNTLPAHYDTHRSRGDYDCFHAVYASQLLGTVKPDQVFWRRILAVEGFDERKTFFVDDNEANVKAARTLGIVAHRFTDAESLRAELEELGAFVA
jgi:putative hydrolase of the HAD superfamily